jgi:hypothetical protein
MDLGLPVIGLAVAIAGLAVDTTGVFVLAAIVARDREA